MNTPRLFTNAFTRARLNNILRLATLATACFTLTPQALAQAKTCPADVNRDGVVDSADLALVLGAFGDCQVGADNQIPYQTIGVTYNGLHANPNPTVKCINGDLTTIQEYHTPSNAYFTAIRTYYPKYQGSTSIGVMNQVNVTTPNMKVLLGLFLFDFPENTSSWTQDDLRYFILPYLDDSNLTGVLVGNEQGAILNSDVEVYRKYINQIRACNPSVPVGSAQTTHFWLHNTWANDLADNCDFIAVNIYPSWNWDNTDSHNQPLHSSSSLCPAQGFQSFVSQYNSIKAKYPTKQIVVTETGWPTTYGLVAGVPAQFQIGLNNAAAYFQLVAAWAQQTQVVVYYYSMFDDHYGVNTTSQYNFHFGLLDVNGNPKQVN